MTGRCSIKRCKISQNSQEKNCDGVSFFNKVEGLQFWDAIFIQVTGRQKNSQENTFFTEHLRETAPVNMFRHVIQQSKEVLSEPKHFR